MTRYVPDALSLAMWESGAPVAGAAVVVAEPLPAELVGPWAALRKELGDVEIATVASPLPAPAAEVPGPGAEAAHDHHDGHDHHEGPGGHEGHDHHEGHGGHDHGDMMAITGEPSADGLVMEPITFQHGPLAAGLPGGLVLDLDLDGDVVSRCEARATLKARGEVPDPLTPAAWRAARAGGAGGWPELAGIERERALSHAAWLRMLARVLGWSGLAARADGVVRAISADGGDALGLADDLARDLLGDRRLRARLKGHGPIAAGQAPGLQGPNARAAGEARDARLRDPRYAALGFEPVVEPHGDAHARTRVRLRELVASLRLARAAFEQDGPAPARPSTPAVEGPRGPLTASGPSAAAPGASAALAAAGAAAVGHEWSAALAVVASFDLSPWRVPG